MVRILNCAGRKRNWRTEAGGSYEDTGASTIKKKVQVRKARHSMHDAEEAPYLDKRIRDVEASPTQRLNWKQVMQIVRSKDRSQLIPATSARTSRLKP